jgi:hypothetical protein
MIDGIGKTALWVELYRAAWQILRADEVLQTAVKTWRIFDDEAPPGTMPTSLPPSGPTVSTWADAELPAIQVNAPPVSAAEVAIDLMDADLLIRLDVATAGLNYADHGNLWGAIFDAFVRSKQLTFASTTVSEQLRASQCYIHSLTADQAPRAIAGNFESSGVLRLKLTFGF